MGNSAPKPPTPAPTAAAPAPPTAATAAPPPQKKAPVVAGAVPQKSQSQVRPKTETQEKSVDGKSKTQTTSVKYKNKDKKKKNSISAPHEPAPPTTATDGAQPGAHKASFFFLYIGLPHGFVQKVANFFKNVAKTLHFFSKTLQKRCIFLYVIKKFL